MDSSITRAASCEQSGDIALDMMAGYGQNNRLAMIHSSKQVTGCG